MKIKSYFANTVEDGMALARQELGPDAMLVNHRKSSPEARHLGAYEVIFVTDMPETEEIPVSAPGEKRAVGDRLTHQMAELKRELEGMRRTITRQALVPSAWGNSDSDAPDVYATLTANEVSPELAREIVQAAEARCGNPAGSRLRTARTTGAGSFQNVVLEELQSRFTVQSVLGRGDARPRIVALVGPPGGGKTTTLVKLAVNYGLAARRPVMILSHDTYRVAAAEQLRSYSTILGVGFQLVETETALAQAIEEHRGKELIFLDTPGLAPAEAVHYAGLAQFLSTRDDIDTQLVVSCSMKSADISRVVDSFESFRPRRLIFTRLDETSAFGPILNEAVRTGKPLSFFTNGQRIPEDLEAATKNRVTDLILSGATGSQTVSAA